MERGSAVAGRYVIEALAGVGGMSAVFKARDLDGQSVAIKVLQLQAEQMDERFAREIALLYKLRHPHIVRYLHSGQTDTGQQFLVVEWLDGIDLGGRLRRGRMRVDEAVILTQRIASALGFAHENGVVHRDVKPQNIFLPGGDASAAKLLDFGVAHWADATMALTRPGMAFGTPAYMAPEQVRGDAHLDARADVFALGCVLFECLTGRPAFAAHNSMAVFAKILLDDSPRAKLADIPAPIQALLQRMLAKDPDDRPRNGEVVRQELEQILAYASSELLPAPAPTRPEPEAITETELHLVSVMVARLEARPDAEARPRLAWAEPAGSVPQTMPLHKHRGPTPPACDGATRRLTRSGRADPGQAGGDQARGQLRCARGDEEARARPWNDRDEPSLQAWQSPLASAAQAGHRGDEATRSGRGSGRDQPTRDLVRSDPAIRVQPARWTAHIDSPRLGPMDIQAAEAARGARAGQPARTSLAEHAEGLRPRFEALGARLGVLCDGSLIVLLDNRDAPLPRTAVDQAVAAARCALVLRRELSQASIAIATGRAEVSQQRLVGEVIERATGMLVAPTTPPLPTSAAALTEAAERGLPIRIDELTARLVQARFAIQQASTHTYTLHGEPSGAIKRRLLGKATPFVGRRQELSVLMATLDECIDEEMARAVVVSAPPGLGKSRLCTEFLKHVSEREEEIEVWFAHGDPMYTGSALSLMAAAICSAAGILGSEPMAALREKLGAYVSDRVVSAREAKRIITFIGELIGVTPAEPWEHNVQLRAARRDPQLMGNQVRRACCELLGAVTGGRTGMRTRPVILVLDDLHWGDRATLEILDRTLRTLAERPLLVLALGRPEIHDLFPHLWSKHHIVELKLGRMPSRAAARLVRASLGEDVAPERMSALIERAEGNPFYLEELLRSAATGDVEQPQTVMAMIHARLSALDPYARRVLRAASVFGHTFWRGGAAALVGEDMNVDDWLEVLIRDELVTAAHTSKYPGESELKFSHALIQEGAYSMLTDRDRGLGHRLAAEWLAQVGENDARVIAEHFERGDAPDKALPFYVRAAEAALDRSDFDAAIALSERGIERGAAGPLLGALRRVQAEEQIWRGTPEAVARLCADAVELLPRGSRAWYGMVGELANAWGKLCEIERLEGLAAVLHTGGTSGGNRNGSDNGSGNEDGAGRLIAAAKLAQQLFINGRCEHADALLAAIEADVGDLDRADPVVAADIHFGRAVRAEALLHDGGVVLQEMERCAARFEEIGDLRQACLHRGNVGYAKLELGLHEEAEADLRAALSTAERIGLDYVAHGARGHLAEVAAHRGALAEAEALARQACTWFAAHGDPRMEVVSRLRLAEIQTQAGAFDDAEREVRASLVLLTEEAPLRPRALATLARVYLLRGQPDLALATATHASRALAALGSVESGESLVRLVYAEALDAAGNRAAARDAIEQAQYRLLAHAQNIGRNEWRARFLQNIPEHAQIMRLCGRWSASSA